MQSIFPINQKMFLSLADNFARLLELYRALVGKYYWFAALPIIEIEPQSVSLFSAAAVASAVPVWRGS